MQANLAGRQLISSIGWSEGLEVYNGRLEGTVLEVMDDETVRLWIKNGQWEGIYNHRLRTMFIPSKGETHNVDDVFCATLETDNFTGYGQRGSPLTATEEKVISDKRKRQRLEDQNWFDPCDECGAHKVSCLCKVPF